MRFGLLGPLAAWTDRGVAVTIRGGLVRALLADLLVHAGEPLSADRLIEDLWAGEAPAKAAGALQSKVSQLRRALDEAEPGARDLVASTPAGYVLRVPAGALDADRFAALAAEARDQGSPAAVATGLRAALALWRGPALAGHAEAPFALPLARRLDEQRVAAVEDLVDARLALGEHAPLVGELDELVRRHPRRERLRGAHMRALYRSGRQGDALATYDDLRKRMVEDLGLEPGPELVRLQHAILVQDPGLDAAAEGGVAVAARPRSNVPAPLTRLVGRGAAVADVVERVADGRLVTLTGPGGVGKTRLALAAAERLAAPAGDGVRFDAVWVVELAGRQAAATAGRAAAGDHGRDRLAEHVAAVLGVRDEGARAGTGTADQLARALADRRVLLVLDNCEHLLAPVAALARVLLGAAPELRILATSREALGVPGELVRPVPPLDLPGPGEVTEASAVQLFVERAAAAAPGFALGDGTAAAVATICRRLDGLPLALELAAARVRGLGVEALAERLDRRFDLLAAGEGWTPARHRTLRAVIDWSWDLLGPGEQAVLRRVAVHAGGFTLDAAEAVGAVRAVRAVGAVRAGSPDADPAGVTPDQVPGLLARLVDRSLVVAEDTPAGVRYRLLETIAEYARERLADAGETGSAHHRHATHHAELAERADAGIRTHDQRRWLDRLDAEAANVRAAGQRAVERGDAALALRLAGAMSWYWYLRGRHREGHRTLGAALASVSTATGAGTAAGTGAQHTPARAHATVWRSVLGLLLLLEDDRAAMWRAVLQCYDEPGVDDERGRARAEWILALVLFETDESPSAGPLAERALERFRRHGDRWGTAAALNVLGWAAVGRSDLAEARRRGEESLMLFRELGDRWGRVRADDLLGVLAEVDGDLDRAADHHRDGLRHAEEIGLWPAVADHLGRLGRLALLRGDHAEADALNHRSLRLASDLGFEHGVVFAEIGLGLSARRQGRLDDAERHLRRGVESHRADGFRPAMAFVLAQLGFVAELRGDEAAARAWHGEGLVAARASGDARSVALAFEGLAGVAVLGGDAAAGARLLGAAGAVRDAAGAPLPDVERADVDRIERAARAALGDAGFTAASRDGEAQGLDAEP